MMISDLPPPKTINRRCYWTRGEIENYKRKLIGLPPVPEPATIELLTSNQVAAELGVGRRTLGRRFANDPGADADRRDPRSAKNILQTAGS